MKIKNILWMIALFIIVAVSVTASTNTVLPPTGMVINTVGTEGVFKPQTNVSSINNNYITIINNITNNITTYQTNNVSTYITYNITNNITNNISNNFYAGWLTVNTYTNITNNLTINVNVSSEIYNNITAQLFSTIYNNISIDIINNIVNNITNNVLNEIYNNNTLSCTLNNNIYNITNNITNTIENNNTIIYNITNNITNTIENNNTIIYNITNNVTNNYGSNQTILSYTILDNQTTSQILYTYSANISFMFTLQSVKRQNVSGYICHNLLYQQLVTDGVSIVGGANTNNAPSTSCTGVTLSKGIMNGNVTINYTSTYTGYNGTYKIIILNAWS